MTELTDSSLLHVPPDDVVECGLPRPRLTADVVHHTTTTAAGDQIELQPDVLTPLGTGPFPTVIDVPGGGFVPSSRVGALIRRTAVAERGHVEVGVDYRTLRHFDAERLAQSLAVRKTGGPTQSTYPRFDSA